MRKDRAVAAEYIMKRNTTSREIEPERRGDRARRLRGAEDPRAPEVEDTERSRRHPCAVPCVCRRTLPFISAEHAGVVSLVLSVSLSCRRAVSCPI
jgi:hypothetical protein